MLRARAFLTKEERHSIESAIAQAEHRTSGEIRIHIETNCPSEPKERALRTFHLLGMNKTANRNGVLIYVACNSRDIAVIGDKGINNAVPDGFWKDVVALLTSSFSEGKYADGLKGAVSLVGEKLSEYFPYMREDVNELADEISIGDEEDGGDGMREEMISQAEMLANDSEDA